MEKTREEQQRMLRQLKKTELLELLIEENDENERLYRLLQEQSAGQAGCYHLSAQIFRMIYHSFLFCQQMSFTVFYD